MSNRESSLAVRDLSAAGESVVLVHGFTQNANCWGAFGEAVAAERQIVAVDAPGHGNSLADDSSLVETARLLAPIVSQRHALGYSMGGRMLLHAALEPNPEPMRSLVLIGATAGIDDRTEREVRRAGDAELAGLAESVGIEQFIDRWLANPLFAGLSAEQACRESRLANRAEGLASSLRNCGTGSQSPLWEQLAAIELPVLVIAGSNDDKFTGLGRRLVESIGDNAQFVAVAASHAVHLESPVETASVVAAFWDEVERT